MEDLLRIVKMARSSYYYHIKTKSRMQKHHATEEEIKAIYNRHHGRYGYRRITLELRNLGHVVNHKTVLKLMGSLGLKSLIRRKKYSSYRGEVGRIAPNLLKRDFIAERPNQKWATDVTEFKVNDRKIYLSPIIEMFNGEIVSYNISESPNFLQVKEMLKGAIKRINKKNQLILHSDQGWQYQMKEYQYLLKENGIRQSMSRKGNCLDNAIIENFFGTLKSELFYLKKYNDISELAEDIEEYIRYYNNDRIKLNLNGMSPIKYRAHHCN